MKNVLLTAMLIIAPATLAHSEIASLQCHAPRPDRYLCDVTNEADRTIKRLSYVVSVKDPTRTLPWVQVETSQSISGGLEPEETVQIEMWRGTLPDRADSSSLEYILDHVVFYDVQNQPFRADGQLPFRQVPMSVAQAVQACFMVDVGAPGYILHVDIHVQADGQLKIEESSKNDPTSAGFEAARRAIVRCNRGYDLDPNTSYTMTFNTFSVDVR